VYTCPTNSPQRSFIKIDLFDIAKGYSPFKDSKSEDKNFSSKTNIKRPVIDCVEQEKDEEEQKERGKKTTPNNLYMPHKKGKEQNRQCHKKALGSI
jgi:hypothetical protein